MLRTKLLSSLDKVFYDGGQGYAQNRGSAMKNEVYHFGFEVVNETTGKLVYYGCRIELEGDLAPYAKCYRVDGVPAARVVNRYICDDYFLTYDSGVFPDICRAVGDRCEIYAPNVHYGYMVEISGDLPVGSHEVRVLVKNSKDEVLGSESFILDVVDALLPPNDLVLTQWIHNDCISVAHNVPVFTDEFYGLAEKYFRMAVRYGQTMALVPLFTVPFDTEIGWERPTHQLVGIKVTGKNKYNFDFSGVERYVDLALKCGFSYLEMSPLYSQWGAAHAPKIVAEKDGRVQQIFGWDTDSMGEEYRAFMTAFLGEFVPFLESHGWDKISYFHISDEPGADCIERYGQIADFIKPLLKGLPRLDALSLYDFYEQGLVDMPAVSTNNAQNYFDRGANKIMVYYCASQSHHYLSNCLLAMPAQRNRVLGFQLYETGVLGFLQWGLNFFFSGQSLFTIDPYTSPDSGTSFLAGDAYKIYPAGKDIIPSRRIMEFGDALQDYRALKLLESKRGREFVLDLLHAEGVRGFTEYPHSAEWHIAFREKVNSLIKESK